MPESILEELKRLRAENKRLKEREEKAIQMIKQGGIPDDAYPESLLEWVTAAHDETAMLRDELKRYRDAHNYPGTDQRHIGTSIATQLVHAQMMREQAEKELEKYQNTFMSEEESEYAKSNGWSEAEYWFRKFKYIKGQILSLQKDKFMPM